MDNKLEKGRNFRVEGSLDSNAVSKTTSSKGENQEATDNKSPKGRNIPEKEEVKRNSTENGNGVSVSNP